ncbi:uroporphyrinogen-III synthase [Neodiprion pinetum]|uniref:uroporphyrinogen-III synthase n=1 Tax=Neodiprion pinetum TaxID=441929 RepID=UPI001EDF0A42|nr:uroporphyrinogen-III synthase-like [Neodiprion pinetum]XP_046489217.1 uroporphyrinogen-III synthase-like [Neodiprion pinetum]XP_046489218.1 uroporphyrinogen-III synthase-like [Neodiprion pinetum]XP_046489219.1 uroporphyrinogen-III synthase-like [Neodiprion pinetum]
MSVARGKVLLCKAKAQGEPEEGEKDYVTVLESAGFSCTQLPVLRFEFINLKKLRALLVQNSYSGLILTSPRSAEAVKLSLEQGEAWLESIFSHIWKNLPIYCIGPTTERVARNILGLQRYCGSESGNAEELAKFIINEMQSASDNPEARPLLYPCSAIARDTMSTTLEAGGITMQKLPVYKTLPSKTLQTDLNDILSNSLPEYVVFFSPSAVRYVTNVIKRNRSEKLIEQMKFVAIGPVTEKALVEAGLKVYATSRQPDPIALSNALQNMLVKK